MLFRSLRAAALETEGDVTGAAAMEEDDAEWMEHDWRWRARMTRNGDAETSRRKTEEERAAEVRARLVHRSGTIEPAVVVSPSSGTRSSGFPKMTRPPDGAVIAWTIPGTPSAIRLARLTVGAR